MFPTSVLVPWTIALVGVQGSVISDSVFTRATSSIADVTPAQWNALDNAVGGRLSTARPYAAPCYTKYEGKRNNFNAGQCRNIQNQRNSPSFLSSQVGGYQEGQWAGCIAKGQFCGLNFYPDINPFNIVYGDCRQGSVSPYYINVASASDVQQGIAFAKEHGVRLAIKSTGHDYQGRSAAPDSLGLWMHNYKPALTYSDSFTAAGCSNSGGGITFGAGHIFDDIYDFANSKRVTIIGGAAGTVSPAGGWATGGGHSPMSVTLGLGVDNILQVKAVLPNGQYVTASRCQNQDIFFAIRGGGGGAFGVVMEMTIKTHPLKPVVFADLRFGNLDDGQVSQLTGIMVANANRWADEGWGGYFSPSVANAGAGLTFLTPILTSTSAAQKSLQPLIDFGNSIRNRQFTSSIRQVESYYAAYKTGFSGSANKVSNLGLALSSRLIPRSTFTNDAAKLTSILSKMANGASSTNLLPVLVNIVNPNPKFIADDRTSSVTPAWRSSTWHVVYSNQFDNDAGTGVMTARFREAREQMQALRELTPGSGAYQNEADVYEPNPIGSLWGQDNYNRLLTIKKNIDPTNILTCRNCINWNPSDPRFGCYPQI